MTKKDLFCFPGYDHILPTTNLNQIVLLNTNPFQW